MTTDGASAEGVGSAIIGVVSVTVIVDGGSAVGVGPPVTGGAAVTVMT